MPTTAPILDPTNNPSEVIFEINSNGVKFHYTLPIDVVIGLDGDKVIAESKILDGVSVFERISRKPFEINFEFTFREKDSEGKYIFPQEAIKDLMNQIWLFDQVITLKNTFLNSLRIKEVILQPISFSTIRGTTNVICSIKAKECTDSIDNYGTTLMIPL
jgi:hypothetical protein